MQLNKLLKALAIAVPMATLAACNLHQQLTQAWVQAKKPAKPLNQVLNQAFKSVLLTVLKPLKVREEQMEALRKNIICFAFDRSGVQSEYAELLAAHADYLVKNPNVTIVIESRRRARYARLQHRIGRASC